MGTEEYAWKLVAKALKPEVSLILRSWFGRPDWFRCGGLAPLVWIGTYVGEWLMDRVAYKKFGINKLESILKQEAAKKK